MAEGDGPKKLRNPGEAIVEVLVVVLLLGALLSAINALLQRIIGLFTGTAGADTFLGKLFAFFSSVTPFLWMISIALCGIMLMLAIYFSRRIGDILAEMKEPLYPTNIPGQEEGHAGEEPRTNKRWERVVEHINSEHPSDWKIAILEADIMLDEILEVQGYHGESMSDKLKQIERSDFLTIDQAWEAHKIRNQIAHEGAEFLINEREARRVISLYEEVFKEFQYI